MVDKLEIPLEEVEDGPVKECLDIIRRWTEGLKTDLETQSLAAFGLKTEYKSGRLDLLEAHILKAPNGGKIVSVSGFWGQNSTWKTLSSVAVANSVYITNGGSSGAIGGTNVKVANNSAFVIFEYRLLIIYEG